MNAPEPPDSGSMRLVRWQFWIAGGGLLLVHLFCFARFLHPSDVFAPRPVLGADFPEHTYHAHVYRTALLATGYPWGYDPAVAAGKTLLPAQDAGSRLVEVLGVVCPWLPALSLPKVLLVFSALLFPLGSLLAMRWLKVAPAVQWWGTAIAVTSIWLYPSMLGFLSVGMVDFAIASFLLPLALAALLRFCREGERRFYWTGALLLSIAWLAHVLGVVIVAPALAAIVVFDRALTRRKRVWLLLLPVWMTLLNLFWLVPFLMSLRAPIAPGRDEKYHPQDLVYTDVSSLAESLSAPRIALGIVALGLLVGGIWQLRRASDRRTAAVYALALGFGLVVKVFGSFVPVLVLMNPVRFLLPVAVLAVVPLGAALAAIMQRWNRWAPLHAAALGTCLLAVAAFAPHEEFQPSDETFFGGAPRVKSPRMPLQLPMRVPVMQNFDAVLSYIERRCEPAARLLIQTDGQCEQLVVPLLTGRETIGSSYPDQSDPAQFHRAELFGRKLSEWQPDELRETLHRWRIHWAFTCTPRAATLFEAAFGERGEAVGKYRAFRCAADTSRFLHGTGRADVAMNRISLSEVVPDEDGRVVLSYRYHPAWQCADSRIRIRQHGVPEDPVGFLSIEGATREIELVFRPELMFGADWPGKP